MAFELRNPYTGETGIRIPFDTDGEIQSKITRAAEQFPHWKQEGFSRRAALMENLGNILEKRKEELARNISLEMGKPIRECRAEIEKCALTARYYALHAEKLLEMVPLEAKGKAEVHFRPLGVIFGIFPWNYPVWQVLRFAIPTLMAGNTALFKCAENTPLSAEGIVSCFLEAGFEEGCIQTVYASIPQIESIVEHPSIMAVTLTGSGRAGSSVAALAGKHLKKVVLELGGSDPFVVLPGADLKQAARTGAQARFQNTGQSCIAAKRFIIHESVFDTFTEYFQDAMDSFKPGDPLDENTLLGVIARKDLCDQLEKQVETSIQLGATRLSGATRNGETGFLPGILLEAPEGSPAYTEELFGPVASFFRITDEEEAVRLANATHFGLGASVWTEDPDKFRMLAAQIESGMVYWNDMVKSTPELPFGGIKNSGIGRELSVFGIREFTNTQLLYPFS